MSDFQLLIDLHKPAQRQGPGGDAETELAIRLAGLDATTPLKVADIGCGTGASTIALAKRLNAQITAVDFLRDFLDVLDERAAAAGVADRITTLGASMDDLPFADEQFDVLWSEGAIYNIGFRRGVASWRRFLKPGGRLVVSEITWLTDRRPAELQRHWEQAYPEIDVASAKIQILEQEGYTPLGTFVLPEHCWLDHYYRPMQARFDSFLEQHGDSEEARALVDAERQELALYERYKAHYSYGVYIAQRLDET
ncbi:MAG: methyltransferase domain-containing protein [Acidobacteriota bacterium]